jgi:hypothetical protein
MKRLLCVPVAMLFVLSIPHGVAASPLYVGAVSDPLGDSLLAGPDIVSAEIVVDDLWVTFTMRFAAGTWDSATVKSGFSLDLDQNSATGGAFGSLGVDAVATQGYLTDNGTAYLTLFPGNNLVGSAPVDFLADGVRYAFQRALFGGEDGALDFFATVQVDVRADASTPILDFAPDFIAGPASTVAAVPEPATLGLLGGGLSLLAARRRRAASRVSDR